MRLSAETLLVLLIVALFIQDSLLFLRPDEGVFVRGARNRWRAGFGTRSWRLSGKEPYLCNPFTPHAPVYRMRWQMTGSPKRTVNAVPAVDWLSTEEAVVPRRLLSVLVWITWAELFVLIPLSLSGSLPVVAPVEAAALLYLNIVLSISVTWVWRRPIGLPGKVFAKTAVECLLCAPYAANLVRRIGFARDMEGDFLAVAERLLNGERLRSAQRECLARINEQMELEVGDDEAASLRLKQLRISSANLTAKVGDESQ